VLLTLLGGCGAPYEVGSFTDYGRVEEPRMRAFECIDVRLQPRGDGAVGPGWVAIDYELGNRCLSPVEVDLTAVTVFAEGEGGVTPMALHDPRDEVVVATLDGRRYAAEALAYENGLPAHGELARVCVDLSGLAPGDRVSPVCFRRHGERMMVEATR
jgi:hypothetical protein